MKKIAISVGIFFLTLILSCNIFEPNEVNTSKWYAETGDFWIIEGKRKMETQDWIGALADFQKASTYKNKDGLKYSEAYFYIGKCILRINSVSLGQVWDEINPGDKSKNVPFLYNPAEAPDSNVLALLSGGTFNMSLYDFEFNKENQYVADTLIDSVFLERKRIYDAMSYAIRYLDTIYYQDNEMDGVIKRIQYESDYLIEISVTMILSISDINHNGKLDYDSDERKAFKILSLDIPNLDEMEFDSLKTISKNPNEIKKNLDSLIHTLELADSSFNNFSNELKGANMDTTMVEKIGEMIHNFKTILPYFYYDDYKDNDGDWYNTNGNSETILITGTSYPKNDRMIWIDWDQDTLIDIYSPDDTGTYGHIHIGDSIHIALNKSLYEFIDTTDKTYRRYRYKGGYNYEFIGGDWGSDEEIMDGYDNDNDGLVDEDTRNVADSLDDDGDWYNTDSTTILNDTIFNSMVWSDVNSNSLIDILQTSGWINLPISTQFKGLHEISFQVQYSNTLPDSLKLYRGAYSSEFTSGDYGLDEEWYDGIDNDGDGLTDEDVGERSPPASLRLLIINKLTALGLRG